MAEVHFLPKNADWSRVGIPDAAVRWAERKDREELLRSIHW